MVEMIYAISSISESQCWCFLTKSTFDLRLWYMTNKCHYILSALPSFWKVSTGLNAFTSDMGHTLSTFPFEGGRERAVERASELVRLNGLLSEWESEWVSKVSQPISYIKVHISYVIIIYVLGSSYFLTYITHNLQSVYMFTKCFWYLSQWYVM